MTIQASDDVHVRVQRGDVAHETGKRTENGPKTARPRARARAVLTRLHLVDQEDEPIFVPDSAVTVEKPESAGLGSMLLEELQAGQKVAAAAAEDSPWAGQLMSPLEALKTVAPAKGEAANWIVWTGMTAAGISRLLLVTVGYLIARGGETRIRAGVVATLLALVVALSFLLGHATA